MEQKIVGSAVTTTLGAREGVPALAGTDLQIEDGEFVRLVGPSGCGKCTLFCEWLTTFIVLQPTRCVTYVTHSTLSIG